MKTVSMKVPAMLAGLLLMILCVHAQDTSNHKNRRGGSKDSTKQGSTQRKDSIPYSDTAFVNQAVKDLIIEYKVAESMVQRTNRPKIKSVAGDVMRTDREALMQLLSKGKQAGMQGVSESEFRHIIDSISTNRLYSTDEEIPQGLTGNTATDSLGSGKSGSGDVNGKDTGTLTRTHSKKRSTNYSEQGEYAHNDNGSGEKGSLFVDQWLDVLLQMQNKKIASYTQAIDNAKDDNVRSAALAILPRARMLKDNIARVIANRPVSRSIDPTAPKDIEQQNNSGEKTR